MEFPRGARFTPPKRPARFTSPMYREDLFAKHEPQRKRNPIGFVHFGEPEEEPRSYLDEYIEAIQEESLHVGFTAPEQPF